MRNIDRMMMNAQSIHAAMQPTIFLVLVDECDPAETIICLKSPKGIERIKETHKSKEDAYRYVEEMEKKYRVAPNRAKIIDDYLTGYVPRIIDNIPYVEEESDEREENAIKADLCHGS